MRRSKAQRKAWYALVAAGIGAAQAVVASASTVSLSSGDAGGGLTLNSANVLIASGPTLASASTAYGAYDVVQGATFLPNTTGTVTATSAAGTYTLGISAASGYVTSSNGVYYTQQSYGNGTTVTTAGSQPTDTNSVNLAKIVDNVDYSNNGTSSPVTVTIGGLSAGQQYVVDLLQSADGYGARTDKITFNDGTTESVDIQDTYPHGYVFDTNDTITANGSGDIIATIVCTSTNGSGQLVNAVVVSALPEPSALGLLAIGSLSLCRRRRRSA